MRVAFFDLEPWQVTYLQQRLAQVGLESTTEAHFSTARLTLDRCAHYAMFQAIASFVWAKLDAELIEALPDLRLILTMSTGYDHIDLETCRRRGITVCNVPNYGENTVAEQTLRKVVHACLLSPNTFAHYCSATTPYGGCE